VTALKSQRYRADPTRMTARPELPDAIWIGDTQYLPVREPRRSHSERRCQDCGSSFGADCEDQRDWTGERFRICRSCYDAYVDNAGR
jgi:hypothetical protein